MGKRELLLVGVFVILGAIVYQFTAPPSAPGERSFSLSQLIGNIRREMRGRPASAEVTTPISHAVPAGATELRLAVGRMDITVTGEDRADIAAELHVRSNGVDKAEAEQLARATTLRIDDAGPAMLAKMDFPEPGQQTATLDLKVPKRLAIRLDPSSGDTRISNVASVEIMNARGDTRVTQIAGAVVANQTGGNLQVTGAGSLKVTTRGSDATIDEIRGEATMNLRNGEVKASNLAGAIDLESNGTDVTLEKLEEAKGMFRANANNGTLIIRGLRTEARIDARNAELTVDIDRAAPIGIYSEGEDDVTVIAPEGGYQLDALAQRAEITLPDEAVKPAVNGEERRATGPVRGGGPTITIRATRGDIVIKNRGK
ncbi:MAG TPA: hypothetical protein VF147_16600 [Vicinamibacterales bacterium]